LCKLYSDTFISRSDDDSEATEPSETDARDSDSDDNSVNYDSDSDVELEFNQMTLVEEGPLLDEWAYFHEYTPITAINLFQRFVIDNLVSNFPRGVIWIRPLYEEDPTGYHVHHHLQVYRSITDDGTWTKVENFRIVNDDGTGRTGPWSAPFCRKAWLGARSAVSQ